MPVLILLLAMEASPHYSDAAARLGIHFRHRSGSPAKSTIVEAKGCGGALWDYDGDGDLDLYLVNGQTLDPDPGLQNALYRNDGRGYTEVTEDAGVGDPGWGYGCAVADYDNDGDLDLFVTNLGPDRLYRNQGDGTFLEVGEAAGVADAGWSASAAFADLDRDGLLDLYVARYLDFDPDRVGSPCHWRGLPVYCGPVGLPALPDRVYRNRGDGRFEEVSAAWGFADVEPAYGLGVVVGDFDRDGQPEVYVANDSVANYLFDPAPGSGRSGVSFEEIGLLAGVALAETGMGQAGMGVAAGDADGDGLEDLFVTNFSHDHNSFYRNLGDLLFEDASFRSGLAIPSLALVGFGTAWLDHDNDGDLDLFVANGHVYPTVVRLGLSYGQANQLFENLGGRFTDSSRRFGLTALEPGPSRGVAVGDIDADGDLEMLVAELDLEPKLLLCPGKPRGHWLRVDLVGRTSNRDAIGARVTLRAGGREQVRERRGAYSLFSHSELTVHFGLGPETQVDSVSVEWPSGLESRLTAVAVDQTVWIVEPLVGR